MRIAPPLALFKPVAVGCALVAAGLVTLPTVPVEAQESALELEAALRLALMDPKPTAEELPELLERLETTPDDVEARLRLLNYYRPFEAEQQRSWEGHLIWLLEKHPAEPGAGRLTRSLVALPYEEAAELSKRLWLEQVERFPDDPQVQANAANFFSLHDRELAESFLEKAKSLEPKNPRWSLELAQILRLKGYGKGAGAEARSADAALKELEQALVKAPIGERHVILPSLAKNAYDAGKYHKAQAWAEEMIQLAAENTTWNRGNLHHHGHLILGRLALRKDDVAGAVQRLLTAAETTGSPQLRSFGPNMTLARDLLKRGERQAVLDYLARCEDFWTAGGDKLRAWTEAIEAGRTPEFGANLLN